VVFLKRLFAPLAALLALVSPSIASAKASQTAHPALWQLSDHDTTIYLFGTIHLLPDNYQWRSPKLDQAMSGSQQLIVETIIDQKDPTKLMNVLAGMAYARGLPPLSDRVPAAKRDALAKAVKESGIPPAFLDQMKTWAAAFMLLGNQYRQMGLKGTDGVESILRDNFTGAGKPIGELETNADQLGFFDKLPEAAQRALLEGSIEASDDTTKEFQGMLKAWSKGDVEAIARSFDQELSGSPDLKEALLRHRNANWSKWIEQRMAQPGTIIVAVGAGHLAGPDSVISFLKKDGYHVRRVQ
jgi:uncharacterized protein YbaP (TraB family)